MVYSEGPEGGHARGDTGAGQQVKAYHEASTVAGTREGSKREHAQILKLEKTVTKLEKLSSDRQAGHANTG